ncbi:MAG TPA: hypothetical protein VH815_10190, partial [Acidobacteriota bacterium]
ISHWNKPMVNARLSPDGHTVAFFSPVDGVQQVFIMLTSGGEPLQLTKDENDKIVNGFSIDGTEIFYSIAGRNEQWSVPTLGGAPSRVLLGYRMVQSPDGNTFFYLKIGSHDVFQADKSGLNERVVYSFKDPFSPAGIFAYPDGKYLLVASLTSDPRVIAFYKVDLHSNKGQQIGSVPDVAGSGSWEKPGETLLLNRTTNDLVNLWRYRLKDSQLTQITFGAGADQFPMADPSGKGIYFVTSRESGSLIYYDATTGKNEEIVSELSTQPILSSNGMRVMYNRILQPGKQEELWVTDIDGKNKVRIAASPTIGTGTWSADGSKLSFMQAEGAFIAQANGKGLKKVQMPEVGRSQVQNVVWSPDGESLYLSTGSATNTEEVWKANTDGTHVEKFMDCCIISEFSPDGKYLLGAVISGDQAGIYQISMPDKKMTRLVSDTNSMNVYWGKDGKSIFYPVTQPGETTFYKMAWQDGKATGKPEVVLKLPFTIPLFYRGNGFDITRDLSTLVYVKQSTQSDLFLLSYEK